MLIKQKIIHFGKQLTQNNLNKQQKLPPSVTSHMGLSPYATLRQTPSPSSMTYFMDGPRARNFLGGGGGAEIGPEGAQYWNMGQKFGDSEAQACLRGAQTNFLG